MKKSLLLTMFVLPLLVAGQPPAGYYNSATGLTCSNLKTALKNIVTTGHVNQGYTALWSQYLLSDVKPREVGAGSPTVIWDIYSDNPNGTDPYNFTPVTQQDPGTGGGSEGQYYNREHTVPLSWHSGSTGSYSGSDYHHVFPTDKKVNAERGSMVYGKVATASWTSLNGSKVGSSAVAGISGTVFEPIDAYKGDVARAFLYFVTRYQDDMPSWGSNSDATRAFDPNTFPSVDIPYLRLMIQWHHLDPVSQKEIDRNNAAYTYQGNRNPFVDFPQYVDQVWNAACPGLAALPVEITLFTGELKDNRVSLKWDVATEINLEKYVVERSFNGTDYVSIAIIKAESKSQYQYYDNIENLTGRRVYYRIRKVDNDGSFGFSQVFTIHIPLNVRFSVYPNPAKDFFQLRLNTTAPLVQIAIMDMAGRLVMTRTERPGQDDIIIPTNGIAAGRYILKLFINGETFNQPVVIAR